MSSVDVSNRTTSKAGNMNQNIGDRTRSKIQFIQNSVLQGNIFPLHDAIKFEDKRREKRQEVDLQLGSNECRAYQSVILESKLQCQLDHLRQLHVLDKNVDGHDRSWECIKVLSYSEERTADDNVNHRCLVEWNDLNKSQSWVNFFALCLSNPTPVVFFTKEHQLLDRSPFSHLIPYCKPKASLKMSKAFIASSSLTTG
jgi:hypothetical protein